MDLHTGIGTSTLVDGYEAGLAAARAALDQLHGEAADLAFVFATIGYEHEDVLDAVAEVLGETPIAGGTFEGIIGHAVADEGMYAVQVVALRSAQARLHSLSCDDMVAHPREAGEALGRRVASIGHDGNAVLFLFPDFRGNITELFEGIERHCEVPFIGGTTADNVRFQRCYQFHDGRVLENACSAVLMSGDFRMVTTVSHGSEPIDAPCVVTRAEGNVVLELDGRPALDFATERMGTSITPDNYGSVIPLMGIGFRVEDDRGVPSPYRVRAIHGFDFDARSIIMPTVLPEGTSLQFMRRNPQSVVASAHAGALEVQRALEAEGATPSLICQFDCAGRGKVIIPDEVLGSVERMQALFPADVPWMGLFAFGEISPVDGENHYHNFTATLAVFY